MGKRDRERGTCRRKRERQRERGRREAKREGKRTTLKPLSRCIAGHLIFGHTMTLQRAHTHTRTHPLHSLTYTHSRSWAQFPFPLGFVMFPDTSFVGCRSSTPFIHNCRMHLFKPSLSPFLSLSLALFFSLCTLFALRWQTSRKSLS